MRVTSAVHSCALTARVLRARALTRFSQHFLPLRGLRFARSARSGRSGTADPAEAAKNSGLGRLAAPRSDGLGTERPSAPHLPEDRAAEDADFVDEGPGEVLAVDLLATAASKLHKHAVEGFDEPLPLEALDTQDSLEEHPLPHVAGGHSRPLKPPYEHIPRAPPGLLQRLAEVEKLEGKSQGRSRRRSKRQGQFEFDEDVPIRVRVLDVDALDLEELHKAFMYTLVRRRPAEICVRVASRLAVFRDKPGQQSYQNLLQDAGRLFGSLHGPELLALFARCFSTISVPFMIDYTRKYGHFSRAFLAEQVEKSLRPGFFDFLRYDRHGGVRPLPLIVSKPWSLGSYTRLMTKSYLKSRMHEQLKLHGHVPNIEEDTDPDMPAEARVIEHLSRAGSLRVEPPKAPAAEVERPALLDAIVQAEYSGVGWDAASQSEWAKRESMGEKGERGEKPERPRPILRGARRAMAEADLHSDSAGEGYSDFYDSSEEELVSDDEDGMSGSNKFGLQFERVVPDSAYQATAEDGALVDGTLQGEASESPSALEEALADRWWSQLRRHFFRHNYRAYRLLDGRWQRVPDPNGPRYKPRQRKRPRGLKREEAQKREMRAAKPAGV